MPPFRIEIESYGQDLCVAEVEVGGLIARRATVRGCCFMEIMVNVANQYEEFVGRPTEPTPEELDQPV